MEKTLLICVGCQKGGTDWLANYFDHHPEIRGGLMKEMEVFSVHFLEQFKNYFDVKISEAELLNAFDDPDLNMAPGAHVDRLKRQASSLRRLRELSARIPDYAAYYRELMDEPPGVDLAYDISPNYAALTAEHWREIRGVLEAQGIACRLMLVMRDPVDRIVSAWRMARRKNARMAAARKLDAIARMRRTIRRSYFQLQMRATGGPYAAFLNFAMDEINLLRSRYDATIRALEEVFPAEHIHYEFFETLFSPKAIERIARFLDIGYLPAPLGARINSSPAAEPILPDSMAKLREALDPTYAFCAERFGRDRIVALWPNCCTPLKARIPGAIDAAEPMVDASRS